MEKLLGVGVDLRRAVGGEELGFPEFYLGGARDAFRGGEFVFFDAYAAFGVEGVIQDIFKRMLMSHDKVSPFRSVLRLPLLL